MKKMRAFKHFFKSKLDMGDHKSKLMLWGMAKEEAIERNAKGF